MMEIVLYKAARRLEIWEDGRLRGVFPAALGREPNLPKQQEGDGRTPEGDYFICARNDRSRFYLSLGLSYPNAEDGRRGLAAGRIDEATLSRIMSAQAAGERPPWDTALGGEIMIHGHGTARDWTAGCIAVDDLTMDLLWLCCPLGTPVRIQK